MSTTLGIPLWMKVALVGSGGALGALCRVGLAALVATWAGQAFWGTVSVNVVGCLLMGLLRGAADHHQWGSPQMRMWCGSGVLGALTTFSTFEMDGAHLWAQGQRLGAVVYLGGSVAAGLGAYAFGWWLVGRWK